MTLLIACLIIHGLHMNGWLYVVAVVMWIARNWTREQMAKEASKLNVQELMWDLSNSLPHTISEQVSRDWNLAFDGWLSKVKLVYEKD